MFINYERRSAMEKEELDPNLSLTKGESMKEDIQIQEQFVNQYKVTLDEYKQRDGFSEIWICVRELSSFGRWIPSRDYVAVKFRRWLADGLRLRNIY